MTRPELLTQADALDVCPDCNGEGWHECVDFDGYASATNCHCEAGDALREKDEREHGPRRRVS
jgi:hypothetical protein